MPAITLRRASADDLAAVVMLHDRSRRVALPFLPVLHSLEENQEFFGRYVAQDLMTLAVVESGVVGFMVQSGDWIEQLYLDPHWRGRGVGALLLDHAKTQADNLQLWCFVDNQGASRFYQRQGFVEQGRTPGDNEAGLPDILYCWRRR